MRPWKIYSAHTLITPDFQLMTSIWLSSSPKKILKAAAHVSEFLQRKPERVGDRSRRRVPFFSTSAGVGLPSRFPINIVRLTCTYLLTASGKFLRRLVDINDNINYIYGLLDSKLWDLYINIVAILNSKFGSLAKYSQSHFSILHPADFLPHMYARHHMHQYQASSLVFECAHAGAGC